MLRRAFLSFQQDSSRSPAVASPRAGQGDVGELFNPDVAGRPRTPTLESDNDVVVRDTELKLRCS